MCKPGEITAQKKQASKITNMYKTCDCQILEHRPIAHNTYWLKVESPKDISLNPGQFCEIQIPGFYLRRPISLCDFDDESITMIYKVLGQGTKKLTSLKVGASLNLIAGLGNGFTPVPVKQPLLVGGGVGVPPLYALAKQLLSQGAQPRVFLGFNQASEIFLVQEFKDLGLDVYISTLDGSEGSQGTVIDVLDQYLGATTGVDETNQPVISPDVTEKKLSTTAEKNKDAYIYACGPEPMLRALRFFAATQQLQGQFSMEERMGCGFGACVGCSLKTQDGVVKVCTDGPIFDMDKLLWIEQTTAPNPPSKVDSSTKDPQVDSSTQTINGDSSTKTIKIDSTTQAPKDDAPTQNLDGVSSIQALKTKSSDYQGGSDRPTGKLTTYSEIVRENVVRASASAVRTSLCGIELANPLIPASGTFGFGYEFAKFFDLNLLGSIALKGTTSERRFGNPTPRIAETASGLLNAVGLQNPGIDQVIDQEIPKLRQYFHKPAIANISGFSVEQYVETAIKFDREPAIGWLEINISCPNVHAGGMSFGTSCDNAALITREIKANCHKPIIVKLSPNVTDIVEIAAACAEQGADAICLINTLLGMRLDIRHRKPLLANRTGGLSGPAVFPVALRMVYDVYNALKIPIIGAGGISHARDVIEMMMAGACAVEIGSANLVNPLTCPQILQELPPLMQELGIKTLTEIIGSAVQ